MGIKPLGNRLLVRKCFNPDIQDEDGKTLVVIPDKSRDMTVFVEILDVSSKCKFFAKEHIGATVRIVRNLSNHLHRVPDTKHDYLVGEDIVEPFIYG